MSAAQDRYAGRTVPVIGALIGSTFVASVVMVALDRPVPVLSAFILLVGVIVVVRYPSAALVGLLFLAPLHTAIISALANRAHLPTEAASYWKDVLIMSLFARAVVERLRVDRRLTVLRDPGDRVLMFYILAFVVIAFVSPPRATVYPALARYIQGPLLFLAIVFLRPSRRQLWWCVGALVAAGTVMGVGALIERLGPQLEFQRWYGAGAPKGGGLFTSSGAYRAGSFLNSPLVLGFFLAGVAPLAVAVATVRTRWRVAAVLAFAACGGGLITTVTRSGFLGGGIGLLVVLLLTVRNPRIRLSLVGIVIVTTAAFVGYYASTSKTFVRAESNEAHGSALRRDMDLLVARPAGYGLGTTDRFSQVGNAGRDVLGVTESTYFAVALEGGIHAFIIYAVALFVTGMRVRSARVRARRAGDLGGSAVAAGALGSMAAVTTAGLFLGIHELSVEVVLWGAPALAIAWSMHDAPSGERPAREKASLLPVG